MHDIEKEITKKINKMGEMSEYYRDFQAEANEDMDIKNELIINKEGKIMEMENPFEKFCKQCENPNLKGIHTCEKKPNRNNPDINQNKALRSLKNLYEFIKSMEQVAQDKQNAASAELDVLRTLRLQTYGLLKKAEE